MSNAKDQSRPCDDCRSSGITSRMHHQGEQVYGPDEDIVWCHCVFARCSELGFFDAGRGEETHACQLRPGHDGPDHRDGPVSWRIR